MIPERYLTWLRTGGAERLGEVLEHNREDVVSLGRLLVELTARYPTAADGSSAHPGDLAGLGRAYLRRGRAEDALACFRRAADACRGDRKSTRLNSSHANISYAV